MAIHFLNIKKEEFKRLPSLHKHLSLENALSMLDSKSLYFSNPMEWKDPFEKRFLQCVYDRNGGIEFFPWFNRVFCTCFTRKNVTEAHWKTYSGNQIAIEFKINPAKLYEILSNINYKFDIYVGKVEYLSTEDIQKPICQIPVQPPIFWNEEGFARLMLLKRRAFNYEDEIRIILVKNPKRDKEPYYNGYTLEFDCESNELIKKIVIGPETPKHTSDMLKKAFEDFYGFTAGSDKRGRKAPRIFKSNLYKEEKPHVIPV